jgi:membrane-associated phospholipid phosphatase
MFRALVSPVTNPRTMAQAIRPARHVAQTWLALTICASTLSTAGLSAQDVRQPESTRVDKTFFTRRDAMYTGAAIVGTVALSRFDEKIARWARSPEVQGSQSRHDFVDALTHVNETPLTIAAILTYGIGRLGRWPTVTDIGIHASEAMLLTDVTSELIRGPIGRARPRISPDDAFKFEFGKGFTDFGNRAFPSLHSAAAFAMAAVLTQEIHERNPEAAWIAGPILYSAALIPGMTRIYLDQHWASDIVAGAFVGTLFGTKVVHYAHTHRQSKLDRILMGGMIAPMRSGILFTGSFSP